jgi:hypothetical protein
MSDLVSHSRAADRHPSVNMRGLESISHRQTTATDFRSPIDQVTGRSATEEARAGNAIYRPSKRESRVNLDEPCWLTCLFKR